MPKPSWRGGLAQAEANSWNMLRLSRRIKLARFFCPVSCQMDRGDWRGGGVMEPVVRIEPPRRILP